MSSRADIDTDLGQLTADMTRFALENDRLRTINVEMLAALQFALPVLEDGLPESVDLYQLKAAIAKVQNAIAGAERDP
jgi:hypothetical protein